MPNCKSFLVTAAERKSMSGDARDFNNIETRAVMKVFSFSCKARRRRKLRHSDGNIRGIPPLKTGWPSLNVVIFPPVMHLVLDDPKQINVCDHKRMFSWVSSLTVSLLFMLSKIRPGTDTSACRHADCISRKNPVNFLGRTRQSDVNEFVIC